MNIVAKCLIIVILWFTTFSVKADLDFSSTDMNLIEENCNDETVKEYIAGMVATGNVTAEETTTGTALFDLNYPSSSNNSLLKGQLYLYSSNGTRLERGSLSTLRDRGGRIWVTKPGISDGSYYLRAAIVLVEDTSKGCALKTSTFSITRPNESPILSTVTTPNATYSAGDEVSLQLSAYDPNDNLMQIDVDWNDGSGSSEVEGRPTTQNATQTFRRVFSRAGNYTISATAYDTDLAASSLKQFSFTVNERVNNNPTLTTVTAPNANYTVGDEVLLQLSAYDPDDNLKQIDVDWNDGSGSSEVEGRPTTQNAAQTFRRVFSRAGYYTISATAYDTDLAASSLKQFSFTVNERVNNNPTLTTVTAPNANYTVGDEVLLQLSAYDPDDNLKQIDVDWNDGSGSNEVEGRPTTQYAKQTFRRAFNRIGSYTITATAYDTDMARSSTKAFSFNVNSATPTPTIQVNVNPVSAETGSTFTFSAILIDALTSGQKMEIDIGAGYKQMQGVSGDPKTYMHSQAAYTVGENRIFTVRMLDVDGSVVANQSGTYTVTEATDTQYAPSLTTVSANENAYLDSEYCVTFKATDQNSNLKNLFVNWGDDPLNTPSIYTYETNSGNVTNTMCHSYEALGQYTWTATVSDHTDREDSVEKSITVEPQTNNELIAVNDLDGKAVNGDIVIRATNPDGSLWGKYNGWVYLVRDDIDIAKCQCATSHLEMKVGQWQDLNGAPLKHWSQILTTTPATFKLSASLDDGSFAVSNPFSLKLQSTLMADFTFEQNFPQTGPIDITMTAANNDNYTYQWMRGGEFIYPFATDTSVTKSFGEIGWRGKVPIILQVADSNNNLSYIQKTAYIDLPYSTGNAAIEGIPTHNDVVLFNGNLHLEWADLTAANVGIEFLLSRSYNSKTTVGEKPWRFNYSQRIRTTNNGVEIKKADGSNAEFYKADDGLWYPYTRTFDVLIEQTDGTFSLYTKDEYIYHFASLANWGYLQKVSDRNGNSLTLNYRSGKLTSVIDDLSRQYDFYFGSDLDTHGQLVGVVDHTGRRVTYKWNGEQLTESVDVRGFKTTYGYTNGLLSSITDPRGNTVQYNYSTTKKVASFINAQGYKTTYQYGTLDNLPSTIVTAPIASVGKTVYQFDSQGRFIAHINARNYEDYINAQQHSDLYAARNNYVTGYGADHVATATLPTEVRNNRGAFEDFKTTYQYSSDGRGNAINIKNPLNQTDTLAWQTSIRPTNVNQTNLNLLKSYSPDGVSGSYTYEYDENGNLTTTTNPGDNKATYTYNALGQKVSFVNRNGQTTQYKYDSNRFLNKVIDPLGQEKTFVRDALGRALSIKDKRGNSTSFTYDAMGNVLTETDALGGVVTYSYDANSNRTQIVDARGAVTNYTYNASNQPQKVTVTVDGVSYSQSYQYDAVGRVISTTNRSNQTHSTTYDADGNALSLIDPLQHTVTYTYDRNNNVLTHTDEEGRKTTYTYDKLDRVKTVKDHLSNIQRYTYNAQGQVITHKDGRGKQTTYSYDAVGQLISVLDANEGHTRSTYDANGNLLTVTGPAGQKTTYTYDALNRVLTQTDHSGNTWRYSYDSNGNQTSEKTPTGERIVRTFDKLNRVSQKTEYAANNTVIRQITYTYDANGNVLSKSTADNTTQYTYDELNRIKSVTDQFGQVIGYAYNGANNLTALTYPGGKVVNYEYNQAEQLTGITDWLNKTTRYTRNKAGKVTLATLGNGTKAQYSYDNSGRLVNLVNTAADDSVISSHDMTLDATGNITKSKVKLPILPTLPTSTGPMTYDDNNRILTATGKTFDHDLSGRITEQDKAGTKTNYNFDVNNRLTSIEHQGATTSQFRYNLSNHRISFTQNGVETRYVIDENRALANVIAQTDNNGTISRYYIYGEGLVSQIDASNNSHYYHYNPTGHTLALTDSNGVVSDKYAYTPYGHTTSEGTTHNPFKFVGRYGVMNDGNGLHYMRARYYKEDIKRFISLDELMGKMVTPQSLNRYAYALGNPIMGVDPSGLFKQDIYNITASTCASDLRPIANYELSPLNGFSGTAGVEYYFWDSGDSTFKSGLTSEASIDTIIVLNRDNNGYRETGLSIGGGVVKCIPINYSGEYLDLYIKPCAGAQAKAGLTVLIPENGVGIGGSGKAPFLSFSAAGAVNLAPAVDLVSEKVDELDSKLNSTINEKTIRLGRGRFESIDEWFIRAFQNR